MYQYVAACSNRLKHVAICINSKQLIHAYGPKKKVLIMPIKKTIDRIYNTAGLKVISARKI